MEEAKTNVVKQREYRVRLMSRLRRLETLLLQIVKALDIPR